MNPSNTCTCGHDKSEHGNGSPMHCLATVHTQSMIGICPCTRFTPTADSTDELEAELLIARIDELKKMKNYITPKNATLWQVISRRIAQFETKLETLL